MATSFTFDEKVLQDAVGIALTEGALKLQDEVIRITPRDPARPPKNTKAKVTGNLKKSIGNQKISNTEYVVGIREGFYNTEEYGYYQEYGTIHIPPRSFLRKALLEQASSIQELMQNVFTQYLAKRG